MIILQNLNKDFINQINTIGIPKTVLSVSKTKKCGITGTHVDISVDGTNEENLIIKTGHEHHHNHEHHEGRTGFRRDLQGSFQFQRGCRRRRRSDHRPGHAVGLQARRVLQ